ncbi:MAG: FAD-dependent oxidoreductase [Myxococcales bacterium]
MSANPLVDRPEQALPRLTDAQLARVATFGERRTKKAGEVLFALGQEASCCFVVLTGRAEILAEVDGRDMTVLVHGPGEFTGELNLLSSRRALVRGQMQTDGEVIVLESAQLRRLVQRDAELGEIFVRAFILRHMGLLSGQHTDLVLLGSRHSANALKLKEFLTRNGQPYRFRELESDPGAEELVERLQLGPNDLPVVVCSAGRVLKNPSIELLAEHVGLSATFSPDVVRDVVIVGAGPAGLGAAVYAASEGLDVLVLESTAPGGQAGTSSRIENYLGFPLGISGLELAARASVQAEKFGADIAVARNAVRLDCTSRPYRIELANGEVVRTKTVVVATGARYRKPTFDGLAHHEGQGVYYSATHLEAQLCEGEQVAVVGGGNSAGQAAVFLSRFAARVHVLVRGPGLADSMSQYLINRLENTPNIELRTRTQIEAISGGDRLEKVRWRHLDTGQIEERDLCHVFVMTGADPNTAWLQECLSLDAQKFVKTGVDLTAEDLRQARWWVDRPPYLMETSLPGVFAVGDVRSSSVKRVASAVGEGSVCVQLLHKTLHEI